MNKTLKSEKGEVMLEGIIVYIVFLMVFFTMIGFMNVVYQHWNMQIVAEDVATKVAHNYKSAEADFNVGTANYGKEELSLYRYILPRSKREMTERALERGTTYAIERLKKTTFAASSTSPTIEVKIINDTLASRHVEVTIENTYIIPFVDFLKAVGFDDLGYISVTASAECVDILDYINTVDFVKSVASLGDLSDSKVIGAIGKVWKAISTIVK